MREATTSALIVIDMQQASLSSDDKYDVNGVVNRINALAAKIRSADGSVIFIQHNGTAEEGLLPNTAGWQLLETLQTAPTDTLIQKTTNDAFYNTTLEKHLRARCVENLIVCGWATDFCVDSTIRAAISRDYFVSVAADCHTVSDRPYANARTVIEYHNWLWENLITGRGTVQVQKAATISSIIE